MNDQSERYLNNVKSFSCGEYACAVVFQNGDVDAWGGGDLPGRLGGAAGDSSSSAMPEFPSGDDVAEVQCWSRGCAALTEGGVVYTW